MVVAGGPPRFLLARARSQEQDAPMDTTWSIAELMDELERF